MAHATDPSIAGVETRLSVAATAWVVAGALVAIYVLSTVPTPLYAAYRQAFGFSTVTLTLVYAAYVLGTVAAMLLMGRLADQIGRRPIVLASLATGAGAAVLFLLATDTALLFVARIVSGFGVALSSGACTAWIVDARGGNKRAATRLSIGANLLGLGLGPVVGGLLGQYAPLPLRLSYLVVLALMLAGFLAVWFGHETLRDRRSVKDASLRPRFGVPAEIRARFLVPAVGAFATFSVLGFYAALVPNLLGHALHQSSLAVAGGVVGGMFLVATVAVATIEVQAVTGVILGLVLLIPGVAGLVVAEHLRSMPIILATSVVVGVAAGLGYRFGLEMVNGMAPDDRRSELVSGYLLVCYAAISLPVVGVGLVSRASSALAAHTIFGALVGVLAIAALIIEIVLRARERRR